MCHHTLTPATAEQASPLKASHYPAGIAGQMLSQGSVPAAVI